MTPVPKDSHLSILRYLPKCVEGVFCEVELPLYSFLGSSRQTADGGTMYPVERLTRYQKSGSERKKR